MAESTVSSARTGASTSPPGSNLVLSALILVAAVANLNLAVANVALPDIGAAFQSSQTTLNLIAVGYSLGLACSELADPPNWAVVRNMSGIVSTASRMPMFARAPATDEGSITPIMASFADRLWIQRLSAMLEVKALPYVRDAPVESAMQT